MGELLKWGKEKQDDARGGLRDALTMQFNSTYGTDIDDIDNWQNLCRVLGISPISKDLDECRHVRSAITNVMCVHFLTDV